MKTYYKMFLLSFLLTFLIGPAVSSAFMVDLAKQNNGVPVLAYLAMAGEAGPGDSIRFQSGVRLPDLGLGQGIGKNLRPAKLSIMAAALDTLQETGETGGSSGTTASPPVPEPGTMVLLGISLISVAGYMRRVYVKSQ